MGLSCYALPLDRCLIHYSLATQHLRWLTVWMILLDICEGATKVCGSQSRVYILIAMIVKYWCRPLWHLQVLINQASVNLALRKNTRAFDSDTKPLRCLAAWTAFEDYFSKHGHSAKQAMCRCWLVVNQVHLFDQFSACMDLKFHHQAWYQMAKNCFVSWHVKARCAIHMYCKYSWTGMTENAKPSWRDSRSIHIFTMELGGLV